MTLSKPTSSEELPDLVVNRNTENTEVEAENANVVNPVSTEEELEAADILLSLGEVRDDMLDEEENSQLMPVGIPTNIIDAAPVPLRLDQENIDNAIANIIQADELQNLDKDKAVNDPDTAENADAHDTTSGKGEPTTADTKGDKTDDRPKSASPTQGLLKIRTHALKKKLVSKHKYKCMVCSVVKSSMPLINEHHIKSHKLQICAICGHSFALVSSLTRHMYDHDECRYQCEFYSYLSHFESELKAHKIVHCKHPAFQCMAKNCGKWFRRKWELTVHLEKHKGDVFKCDRCDYSTNHKKHLKEHQLKHNDDYSYMCKICNRSGLKWPRDSDHKE